jgi:hypothetical protein
MYAPGFRKLAYDELVSHRFITDDHKVQETVFSSGKRVIVNFGDSEYKSGEMVMKAAPPLDEQPF